MSEDVKMSTRLWSQEVAIADTGAPIASSQYTFSNGRSFAHTSGLIGGVGAPETPVRMTSRLWSNEVRIAEAYSGIVRGPYENDYTFSNDRQFYEKAPFYTRLEQDINYFLMDDGSSKYITDDGTGFFILD